MKATHFSTLIFVGFLTGMLLTGCGRKPDTREPAAGQKEHVQVAETFELAGFKPITNFTPDTGTVLLNLDYADQAFSRGFTIPSANQAADGAFHFRFQLKNKTGKPVSLRYKIYYQNETYKMEEVNRASGKQGAWADENFYGSWEDTGAGFMSTGAIAPDNAFHEITGSLRIVGNPRNEKRYFDNQQNDRWKRNPRVGMYSFLLVVSSEDNFRSEKIPAYISDISLQHNGIFVNPYYFFLHGDGKALPGVLCERVKDRLKVRAQPDLGSGIYIRPENFNADSYAQAFTSSCGQDSVIKEHAPFEQFINNVDASTKFDNIPVVRDIMADDYSLVDYNWDLAFYRRNETIATTPGVALQPCEQVISDPVTHKITIINPGCTEGTWRKQSVGIRTRHGLTYGKYRVKCKMTELLNKNNIWNGLTNAIWLLSQQNGGAWNNRRACGKAGYMATYWGGDNDQRVEQVDYSEIDFEILKTPPYCPAPAFPPVIRIPSPDASDNASWNVPFSDDLDSSREMITVACTNWDMACWEPEFFKTGCQDIPYQGTNIAAHRWTEKYRALTQKQYAPDDELFAGPYYYFEIDWRPTEIIWRIGPSPDKLRVVGYMNDRYTMIPNNQMTLIITQEYHNTKWWPGSPFIQENIPFPLRDLVGEIYEIVIE